MHSRPDRRRARNSEPGPRLRAGAGAVRQGARHRGGAGRPRHQGRHDRRPAGARAHGRHGAELRGRAKPPVPNPPRDEEPLRRHRRDRRVRDGRGGADRGAQPLGFIPHPSRRAGQRHERIPGDGRHSAGAGRDPGAGRAAGDRRDAEARGGRVGQRPAGDDPRGAGGALRDELRDGGSLSERRRRVPAERSRRRTSPSRRRWCRRCPSGRCRAKRWCSARSRCRAKSARSRMPGCG